jgi:hypothetical protein
MAAQPVQLQFTVRKVINGLVIEVTGLDKDGEAIYDDMIEDYISETRVVECADAMDAKMIGEVVLASMVSMRVSEPPKKTTRR